MTKENSYSLLIFKKIEKGKNKFCYNRRYYVYQKEMEKYLVGSGHIKLQWLVDSISNIYVKKDNLFPNLTISFEKFFDIEQRGRKGIYKTKNLNLLEKFILREKLKRLDKK